MVSDQAFVIRRVSRGVAVLAALSGLIPHEVVAQQLYCCMDQGKRTCGDTLPQRCFGKAYTVRGPGGKLIKEVESPLTPEQLKAREELEKKKKDEEVARKEQSRKDSALLSTYSSEEQIEKAKARVEGEIMADIKAAEAKIAAAEKKKKDAVGDPALYKKRGMPEDLKRLVQDYDVEIKSQGELVEMKKKDLEAARAKYAEERQRYVEIKKRLAAR